MQPAPRQTGSMPAGWRARRTFLDRHNLFAVVEQTQRKWAGKAHFLLALRTDGSAERRIGAALALARSGDPEAPTRIRVAARASADPRLRIALESVAAGEVVAAAVEEALAEERVEKGTERGEP